MTFPGDLEKMVQNFRNTNVVVRRRIEECTDRCKSVRATIKGIEEDMNDL